MKTVDIDMRQVYFFNSSNHPYLKLFRSPLRITLRKNRTKKIENQATHSDLESESEALKTFSKNSFS